MWTRNNKLCNLLLLWSLGAFVALVANGTMAAAKITDLPFLFYYFAHVSELGVPVLLFTLGLAKKDPKCLGSTLGITWGVYTAVYGINKLINFLCEAYQVTRADGSLVQVNYMYSMGPKTPCPAPCGISCRMSIGICSWRCPLSRCIWRWFTHLRSCAAARLPGGRPCPCCIDKTRRSPGLFACCNLWTFA